jgi:FAD/FMN-containing dehydrogenase
MAATPPTGLSISLTAGPGMHDTPLGLNSVNPAWRTTYSHTVMGVNWSPQNRTMDVQMLENLAAYQAALIALAPDMGAYVNEVGPFQPKYHEISWGANYPRLLAIKRAVDPEDMFSCRICVTV